MVGNAFIFWIATILSQILEQSNALGVSPEKGSSYVKPVFGL
jgi:hypothetical protein